MSVEMVVTTTKTKNKLDPKIITKYKVGQIVYALNSDGSLGYLFSINFIKVEVIKVEEDKKIEIWYSEDGKDFVIENSIIKPFSIIREKEVVTYEKTVVSSESLIKQPKFYVGQRVRFGTNIVNIDSISFKKGKFSYYIEIWSTQKCVEEHELQTETQFQCNERASERL